MLSISLGVMNLLPIPALDGGRLFFIFIEAIRGNATLAADALTGHLSSTLPHLGNLACRLGRSFGFDPVREQIPGDTEANALLGRDYRTEHWGTPALAKAR